MKSRRGSAITSLAGLSVAVPPLSPTQPASGASPTTNTHTHNNICDSPTLAISPSSPGKGPSGRPPRPPNKMEHTHIHTQHVSRALLVNPHTNIKVQNLSRSPSPNSIPKPCSRVPLQQSSNTQSQMGTNNDSQPQTKNTLGVVSLVKSSHNEADRKHPHVSSERRRTVTALTSGVASSCKEATEREEERKQLLRTQLSSAQAAAHTHTQTHSPSHTL